MQYLHVVYVGDEDDMFTHIRRAPHWKCSVSMSLADRTTRASRLLARAHPGADVEEFPADELDHSQRHRAI
eukprot:4061101-Amphidinium_carterae.1